MFRSLAEEESDCSSAKRRGDLGFFEFKKMKRNFSEVAFKLEVNEVSVVSNNIATTLPLLH